MARNIRAERRSSNSVMNRTVDENTIRHLSLTAEQIFDSDEAVVRVRTGTKSQWFVESVGDNNVPQRSINGHKGGSNIFMTSDNKVVRCGEKGLSYLISHCED